jgi:hypothetical protein
MINVVCVKWGTLYNSDYVNKLYSMVKRNLTVEFAFYCITEDPSNIREEVICIQSPVDWVENQWYKETMFVKGTIPERITLYLDLDVVIVSSLDPLIPKDENDPNWYMGRDFIKRDIPTFHGAVMVFNPKYWYEFFEFFTKKVKSGWEMKRGKEQPLIALYHLTRNYKNFKIYPNEYIWSYKFGYLRDNVTVENSFIYRGYKPADKNIICSFHGWPNLDQVLNLEYIDQNSTKWIRDNWNDKEINT